MARGINATREFIANESAIEIGTMVYLISEERNPDREAYEVIERRGEHCRIESLRTGHKYSVDVDQLTNGYRPFSG